MFVNVGDDGMNRLAVIREMFRTSARSVAVAWRVCSV